MSQRVTLEDIARQSGVSSATVSLALRDKPGITEDTRQRVLSVIRDTGYVPNPQARALAIRRYFLIGLIHDNPNAQMVLNVQQGILEALHGTEFELVVRPVDRGSAKLLEDIRHFLERQRLPPSLVTRDLWNERFEDINALERHHVAAATPPTDAR